MNSLRRRRDFVFRTSSSGTQDPDINVYLRQSDMKNSLSFDIDVEIPVTATTRVTAELNIEYLRNAGSKHTETYPLSVSRTCGTEGFVGFLINEYNVSKGIFYNTTGKELKFPFENLTLHKFEYTVEIHDDGNYSKYEYIYDFTFFETPVRLNSNFTFDTNIGPGDRIYISNLTLDHILDASGNPTNVDSNGNIIDDTHPESVDNNGNVIPNASGLYINNSQQVVNLNGEVVEDRQYDPFVIPAFKFTFQPSDDPNSNASDNTYNNEYNDLYEPRVLEYNANGSYILPANTLPEGTYTMKVLANWADGYYRTKAATSYVHVIKRPVIKSVTAEPLYVKNLNERVVTIAVSGSLGDRIWFNFYDSSEKLVAKAGDTTGFSTVDPSGNYTTDPSGNKVYELSLNDIEIQKNSDGILVGVTYAVKAETKYTRSLQPTDAVRLSDSQSVIFPLKVPVVGDVTEYSVQSDGGDAADQTIATVSVNTTQYYLYAPNVTNGIKFYIYDEGVKVASTESYNFLNVGNSNMYTVTLANIILENVNNLLTNGKDYTLTAEVTLTNHAGDTETRESTAVTVRFSDRIAPVLNLVASNTWELASNFAPSSYTSYFNKSPLIGISGHFKKTAQFNSQYANQLDTELTKFRIEFSLNKGVSWNLVKRAVLSQKLSSESTMQEAINRVRNLTIVEREDGKYDNIPGTIIGYNQEPLVFYIPQYQGDGDAFDETNEVKIRVTVVDTANLWGEGNEAEKISSKFQLINRINTYSFSNTTSSEPWNSTDSNGNLRLNVPVDWQSIHAHSVKVGYKYSLGGTYTYITFNSSGLPVEQESKYVSFVVNPASGTTLYYSVAYIVDNTNLTSTPLTTQGLTAEVNVPNKHFPMASDYTVTSSDYQTFNTDGQSSISFQLAIAADSKNRLDGVNVYFTSTDSTTGSGISKVRIGSYAYSASGSKNIPLLLTSGGNLQIMNDAGVVVESELPWDDYDMANITFEAFRDARVNSIGAPYNSENTSSDPVSSDFYVESGTQSTFGTVNVNPIWNVPVLTRPAEDASADNVYILSGGVINMEDGISQHVITWPTAVDSNELSFSYDLKVTKNDTTVIVDENNLEPNSYVLPIDLNNLAKYTIEVTKVFNGLVDEKRELSPTDTIIFYSIEVDTSAMAVSVQNPSNSSSVTLSWGAPDISGNSVTASGYESSSFGNNISTQYIQYRTTTIGTDFSGDYSRLNVSGGLIEQPSPKLYILPNQALGTLYEFVMYVEAQVKFSLNNTVYSTQSETDDTAPYSTSHDVPLTPRTQLSQYIVSTVPSVESLPHSTPVLVQGSSNPTLLLNLNANGLEHEGFISVVVILTQDGTDEKPEGEQALLIFPDLSGNHPLHPFSSTTFVNTVTGVSGVGAGDVRLAGGESATSTPRNVDDSVLSTQTNSYTLTIGTVGTNRRYGLSRLQMPPTSVSGFVSGSPVNYMIILTTRRGTDIGVGEFTYQAVPSVSNVTISTINGQFFVDFVITPA